MRISRRMISRRTVLALYGASVALACLWVPWKISVHYPYPPGRPANVYFVGYSSLWSPPAPWKIRKNVPVLSGYGDEAILFRGRSALTWVPSIDWQRIGLELLALTALAGVAFLLAPFSVPLPWSARRSKHKGTEETNKAVPAAGNPAEPSLPGTTKPYRFG